MAAPYRIEPCTPELVGAVVALWEDFEQERGWTPGAPERRAFGEFLLGATLGPDPLAVHMAFVGKKVVGYVLSRLCLSEWSRYPRVCLVEGLYVRPAYRHQGDLGHALYAVARDRAAALQAIFAADVPMADIAKWQKKGATPISATLLVLPQAREESA
jgi:GNAT superfamily N-acetyltransferase